MANPLRRPTRSVTAPVEPTFGAIRGGDPRLLAATGRAANMPISMEKINLSKLYRTSYNASAQPAFVTLDDEAVYVSVEGVGDPDGAAFSAAVARLYPVAYAVKFACQQQGRDFGVSKLEGLWWVMSTQLWLDVPRSEWHWQLLTRLPSFVDKQMVDAAKRAVSQQRKFDTADIHHPRLDGRPLRADHAHRALPR